VRRRAGHDVPAAFTASVDRDPLRVHIAAGAQVVDHRRDRNLGVGAEGYPVERVQADPWQVDQQRVVAAVKRGRTYPVVEFLAGVVADDDRRALFCPGVWPEEISREGRPLIRISRISMGGSLSAANRRKSPRDLAMVAG
jgi:hypothetical protein